jgi:hypothetical protein
MEVVKIKISETCATVQDLKMITSGTVGATVSFEFDKTWDGFTKTYVFRAGNKTKDDLDATGVIPAELLKKHGVQLDVGVYGTKGDLVIPTAWASLGTIAPGADPSGDQSTNPHLPVWKQLQEDIEELQQGAGNAVLYTKQTTPEEQKAQARENIGAVSVAEVADIVSERIAHITNAEEVSY